MAVTTKTIVDRFRQACMDHTQVNWFDFSTAEFLFNPQVDLEYPAVFLQLVDGTITEGTREERNFIIYSLQQTPDSWEYTKTGPFDYDNQITEQRDTALQVLRDIVRKVKLENLHDQILAEGTIVFDNDAFSSATGWRQNITIITDSSYEVSEDFPE